MKTFILTPILALLIVAGNSLKAQNRSNDYLGLPGDNLNLYAVMNLFQESETLEAFEKTLNEENSRINNLDLNNDNFVDYITVTDFPEGNVHNIVLQVALSPTEKQDVAVFTVERFKNGSVQIQLIGDETLYGRNYIVEPIYDETPNPGYTGNRRERVEVVRTTYVEVAAWPTIRFIYDPFYTGWHSSWYWGYYPEFWHPWTPCYYHFYYGYHHNLYPVYYSHYRHWHEPRIVYYNDYYYNRMRVYSPTVVVNINKGNYRKTYSKPESRRDGERLYASTRSERSSNLTTTGSRRASQGTVERGAASSGRRSEASSTRTGTRSSDNSVSTSRRSAGNTSVNRSSGNQTTREATSAPRTTTRSAESPRNTSVRSESNSGRSSVSRSSSSQVSTREARSSSAPVQRSSASRSSGESRSSAAPARSSSQRSSSASSSSKASKNSSSSSSSKSSSRSSDEKSSSRR